MVVERELRDSEVTVSSLDLGGDRIWSRVSRALCHGFSLNLDCRASLRNSCCEFLFQSRLSLQFISDEVISSLF